MNALIINKGLSRGQLLKLLAAAVSAAAIVAVAVALTGRAQAAVGGPTCNVPADYATIQLAVDAPGCNTVKVAAGAYNESVVVSRAVNIKGAKANVDPKNRTFGNANESTVTGVTAAVFTVNAADVTIDGFSITNPNQGFGVVVKTAGNNAVVKNNFVNNLGGAAFASNPAGVYLELGPDNVTVDRNKISNIQSVPTAQGVLVGDSTSANPSLGVKLTNNTIQDITSSTKGAYGIQLNNGASAAPAATGYTTGRVTGNTIKNLNGTGWVHAIGLEGDTPNLVVNKNVISNLVSPGADKIAVNFESNVFFFTSEVNRNSLDVGSTAFGIFVNPALTNLYPTLSVDGTCNWWGSKSGPGPVGPGSGSMVMTGVDFKPWLKSSNLNSHCGSDKDFNDHNYGHKDDDHKRWDWGDND